MKTPLLVPPINPPSLTEKVTLIEERINNYAITSLPNDIIEIRYWLML